MSKPRYKQGTRINSIAQFDACKSLWYKWNGKTIHRSVLMSLQYRTLLGSITDGRLYIAELIKGDKTGGEIKFVISDFLKYQVKWLTSHCDIEFDKPEEDLILGFLNDSAECYIAEHTEQKGENKMKLRTRGERKAYLDGYEMCGECLEQYLTNEGKQILKSLLEAVKVAIEIDDITEQGKE